RSEKLLRHYRLSPAQIFVHPSALQQLIASRLIPDSIGRSMDSASEKIGQEVDRLKAELQEFDVTLAAALDKSRAKILYQLAKMRRKTERETLRRNQRAASDAHHLSAILFPHRHLQERFYSILPFLAQHGVSLVDELYASVELDCPDHRIYNPSNAG